MFLLGDTNKEYLQRMCQWCITFTIVGGKTSFVSLHVKIIQSFGKMWQEL